MTTMIDVAVQEAGVPQAGVAADALEAGFDQEAALRSLARAILSPAPRPLVAIDFELIAAGGQYLLHYTDGGAERFKFVSAATMRQAFADVPVDSGWLAPNVVRVGECAAGPYAVLWVPPGRHKLQVAVSAPVEDEADRGGPGRRRRRGRARAEQRGEAPEQRGERAREGEQKPVRTRIDELEAPLPGLVFAGVGTQYHLWAVAEDSFDARAYTYYPPLPNVHDGGTVCWGDNRPPQASGQSILDAWRLFLGSPFSDHLAGQRSRAFPNDVRALLWRFHTEREPHFPTEDLVACPGKPTVGHQVERMIGGDR